MAEDDEQNKGEDGDDEQKDAEDGGGERGGTSILELGKLGVTVLVTLLIFAGIMRGCASCQDKNPLTGEPIQKKMPPPPPPPGG